MSCRAPSKATGCAAAVAARNRLMEMSFMDRDAEHKEECPPGAGSGKASVMKLGNTVELLNSNHPNARLLWPRLIQAAKPRTVRRWVKSALVRSFRLGEIRDTICWRQICHPSRNVVSKENHRGRRIPGGEAVVQRAVMAARRAQPSISSKLRKTSVFFTMPEKRSACGPVALTSVGSVVWVVPVQPMPV